MDPVSLAILYGVWAVSNRWRNSQSVSTCAKCGSSEDVRTTPCCGCPLCSRHYQMWTRLTPCPCKSQR